MDKSTICGQPFGLNRFVYEVGYRSRTLTISFFSFREYILRDSKRHVKPRDRAASATYRVHGKKDPTIEFIQNRVFLPFDMKVLLL